MAGRSAIESAGLFYSGDSHAALPAAVADDCRARRLHAAAQAGGRARAHGAVFEGREIRGRARRPQAGNPEPRARH